MTLDVPASWVDTQSVTVGRLDPADRGDLEVRCTDEVQVARKPPTSSSSIDGTTDITTPQSVWHDGPSQTSRVAEVRMASCSPSLTHYG